MSIVYDYLKQIQAKKPLEKATPEILPATPPPVRKKAGAALWIKIAVGILGCLLLGAGLYFFPPKVEKTTVKVYHDIEMRLLFLRGSGRSGFLSRLGSGHFGFLGLHLDLLLHLTSMANELASRREFTETMADHIFRNENVHMDLSIVNAEGETDHFRSNL